MSFEERQRYTSGAKWESIVGYSRAVRIGQTIEVSGTCAVDPEGNVFAPGDMYQQTRRIIEIIEQSLRELGGRLEDVVRTRIYTTDISRWQEVAKAHQEAFGSISPVTSMVEVSRLIGSEYLVEIEATAISLLKI
jgi:enamine deaminase RidA (YjgF/YER057c/UK114 family)